MIAILIAGAVGLVVSEAWEDSPKVAITIAVFLGYLIGQMWA